LPELFCPVTQGSQSLALGLVLNAAPQLPDFLGNSDHTGIGVRGLAEPEGRSQQVSGKNPERFRQNRSLTLRAILGSAVLSRTICIAISTKITCYFVSTNTWSCLPTP